MAQLVMMAANYKIGFEQKQKSALATLLNPPGLASHPLSSGKQKKTKIHNTRNDLPQIANTRNSENVRRLKVDDPLLRGRESSTPGPVERRRGGQGAEGVSRSLISSAHVTKKTNAIILFRG